MVETPARQQHNRAVWLQQQRERQRTNQDAANVQVVEESPVKEGVLGMHLHSYTHLQVHAHTHTPFIQVQMVITCQMTGMLLQVSLEVSSLHQYLVTIKVFSPLLLICMWESALLL